ncbi:MAG: hypothetical protein F4Z09_07550 [Rhodobacteraceae bacterium]|nr:hypothetical protein [Paracoccaceae bacterium]MYF46398.1 hypothetical protein [Paracoccaceae bacterium]
MQPRDLVVTARRTVGRGQGKPRQSDLTKALSTAYYAMFHALCWNCADCFIGKNRPARNQDAWQQAYRAVEHGEARKRCSRMEIRNFPEAIQSFADFFVFL